MPAQSRTASPGKLTRLNLERSVSLRKHLPDCSDGWLVDSYVVGPENQSLRYLFEHDTIKSLGSISPVLFYGEKSLGKTALAFTLAVRWSRISGERPSCFVTGRDFCLDFAAAVEIDDIRSFRQKFRSCKMLVIDELDPIAEKPSAQQELCETIDALASQGRPIIVTSSWLPSTHSGIKPQLASRLMAGFSIQLARPGRETHAALIDDLIAKIDSKLARNDILYVANDLASDHPLSPSALANLVKLAHQNRNADGSVDRFTLRTIVKQHLHDETPDVATIAKSVCRRLRVRLADVRSGSRLANIARARGLAIVLARKFTTLSLQHIGNYFGGRDHTTILHAVRKTTQSLANDPELAGIHREIEADLLGR